jgi:hypothetical protein
MYLFIFLSCKKKDAVYEAQNNSLVTNGLNPINLTTENGIPSQAKDSIFGYIICERPIPPNKFTKSNVFPYFTEDSIPLTSIMYGIFPSQYDASINDNDTNSLIIEFKYGSNYYKVVTKRTFSNAIFDERYQPQGINTFQYRIRYNGAKLNTDTIETCKNQLVSPEDTIISLQTCNSVANLSKPTRFMISFKNIENFKINGKNFLIIKQATHDFTNY